MVLEMLLSVETVRNKPILILLDAFIISSVSIFLAYFFFKQSSGVLSLAFVTVALMPLINSLLIQEESIEVRSPGPSIGFVGRHFTLIKFYSFVFLGLILSYSFWFVVLPENLVQGSFLPARNLVFSEHLNKQKEISLIKAMASLNQCFSRKSFFSCFNLIFFNNALVLILAIFTSFVYGAGALFLISWNASFIGVVIGQNVLSLYSNYLHFGFISGFLSYFHGLFNALGFLPHGLPEVLAYFLAAIAGGIISVALTKRHYQQHELRFILKDTFVLILISFVLLLIGALIEAQILVSRI